MTLDKALTIISAILGFFGAILLAKGILKLTPEIIASQVETRFGWNSVQLANIAGQKADVISGIILIALAFLIQICALILVKKDYPMLESYWGNVLICFGFASIITGITLCVNVSLKKQYELKTKKIIAKRYLERYMQDKQITWGTFKNIQDNAKIALNFEKKENENMQEFLNRYAEYINFEITREDINWEEFNKK